MVAPFCNSDLSPLEAVEAFGAMGSRDGGSDAADAKLADEALFLKEESAIGNLRI